MKFQIPTGRAFRRRKTHKLSWRRRAKVLLLDLLGREESPDRVAAAIALGVGIGFSPFIGAHFGIALGLALLLRLNKVDTVLGQFVGNPWTLPPVFALGYRLGRVLLRYDRTEVPNLPWDRLLHRDFWQAFSGPTLAPRLYSFLLGTMVIAVLIGLATYLVARALLRLYHRRHPGVAARAARHRQQAAAKRATRRATRSAHERGEA